MPSTGQGRLMEGHRAHDSEDVGSNPALASGRCITGFGSLGVIIIRAKWVFMEVIIGIVRRIVASTMIVGVFRTWDSMGFISFSRDVITTDGGV